MYNGTAHAQGRATQHSGLPLARRRQLSQAALAVPLAVASVVEAFSFAFAGNASAEIIELLVHDCHRSGPEAQPWMTLGAPVAP
jgi:hypothetical protein